MGDEGGEAPCFAGLLSGGDVDDHVLARVVRDMADAVVIADADGTIVFWNEAATRLFGWPAEQALGQSLDLIIPERQRARHWEDYRRVMATGQIGDDDRPLEVPALHADGRQISVAFTVSLLHPPGMSTVSGIAAVLRDDTERWQERRRLREEIAALRGASTPER